VSITTLNITKFLEYIANQESQPSVKDAENHMGLKHESWQRLYTFCINSKFTDESGVEITDKGLTFLFEQKRLESSREHERIIKIATVIIAITAFIGLIMGIIPPIQKWIMAFVPS